MVLTEPELFQWLKHFYYPDLVMSEDQFSSHDCISDKHNYFIELKSRHTHYDDLLIEKAKYDSLFYRAKKGYKPIYINATERGVWQFNLKDLPEPKWEVRIMPANTEFTERVEIDKIVGYFNIKDGIWL